MNIEQIRSLHDKQVTTWKNETVQKLDEIAKSKNDLLKLVARTVKEFEDGKMSFVTQNYLCDYYLNEKDYPDFLKILSRLGYDCYMDSNIVKLKPVLDLPKFVVENKNSSLIQPIKFSHPRLFDRSGIWFVLMVVSYALVACCMCNFFVGAFICLFLLLICIGWIVLT